MRPLGPCGRWYVARMATTVPTLQNFIDSEPVDPAEGQTEPDPQPRHRRGDRQRAPLNRRGRRPSGQRRPRRVRRRLGDDHPGRARRHAAQARRHDRGARGRDRRARVGQRRQADRRLPRRRDPVHGRQPALLRRRGALPRGPRGGRVRERLHVDHPPRAGRRDRPDRALELPADDGGVEDRPGARGREHDRAQAGRDDAADHAEAGRVRGRDLPQGRSQRDHRPR